MKAEIISIGSELTSGQNLDTNSQWLSRRLAEIGIPVGFHTTVADDLEDNVAVFRTASRARRSRARHRRARADAGRPDSRGAGRGRRRRAGRRRGLACNTSATCSPAAAGSMPDRNRVQAMFPRGAEPIVNDCGTAPGVWMTIGRAVVAAMPGVPSEMHAMFEKQVVPRLAARGMGGGVVRPAEDQHLRLGRVGGRGEAPRPDPPRARPGGRHHRQRRGRLASHPGAGEHPGRRPGSDRPGRADDPRTARRTRLRRRGRGTARRRRSAAGGETQVGRDGREHHGRAGRPSDRPGARSEPLVPRRDRGVHERREDPAARRAGRVDRAAHGRQRGSRPGHGRRRPRAVRHRPWALRRRATPARRRATTARRSAPCSRPWPMPSGV